jgi:ABC-2 type transport system ATP-binding protein
VLAAGRVIADGTPDALGRASGSAIVSFGAPRGHAPDELPLPAQALVDGPRVRFRTDATARDLAPILDWAAERGTDVEALTVTRPDLEDVYLELTQEAA